MARNLILEDALERRNAALAEAQRWTDFIDMYSELQNDAPHNINGTHQEVRQGTRRKSFRDGGFPPGSLADTEAAAMRAITEAGRSLHTRELLPLIEGMGVSVGGIDQLSTLSARLSRSNKLANNRRHGWTIYDEIFVPGTSPNLGEGALNDKIGNDDEAQNQF